MSFFRKFVVMNFIFLLSQSCQSQDCYKMTDIYACNFGVQEPFCSDRECDYRIIGWEEVLVPDTANLYCLRPIIEWNCHQWGTTEYDPFQLFSSCEPTEPPGTKYATQREKSVVPVCYFLMECAGCSPGPDFFELPNEMIEGVDYTSVGFNVGRSEYNRRRCNSFRQAGDLPHFARINECVGSLGACNEP